MDRRLNLNIRDSNSIVGIDAKYDHRLRSMITALSFDTNSFVKGFPKCNGSCAFTDFGFTSASTKDQPLAETFFTLRARPNSRLTSAGRRSRGRIWSTRASRARRTTEDGSIETGP